MFDELYVNYPTASAGDNPVRMTIRPSKPCTSCMRPASLL